MALQERLRPLVQILRSPRSFFREYPQATSATVGFAIALLFAITVAGGIWYLGGLLAASTDATVTMDNPERPPDWVCEQHSDDPDSILGEGCDAPATIERSVGSLLMDAVSDYIFPVFFFTLLLWPLSGIVLYGFARLVGGTGGFLETLGVTAWGYIPEFVRLGVGLVGLTYVLSKTTFRAPVESFTHQFETAIAPLEVPFMIATMLLVLWQWSLLTAGIEEVHDLDTLTAAFAVGIPLAVWTLLALI